jgi:hypothetical protein
MSPLRDEQERYVSAYNEKQLFTVLREVLAFAAAEAEPLSAPANRRRRASAPAVSQVAYERARVAAGHPDAPTARAICTRLGLSWAELVDHAGRKTKNAIEIKRGHTHRFAADHTRRFTRADVATALRFVSPPGRGYASRASGL